MVPVAVSDLEKRFGRVRALRGMTFTAAPGRITGLLGGNGAGKSTALRILVGLARADAGTAVVHGRPYAEHAAPLRAVGFVGEAVRFHPGRTPRDTLTVIAAAADVDPARIDAALDEVELTADADRPTGGFSLGMRQRLGLAVALLPQPDVLLLDEPMNGLDPHGVRWLRAVLRTRAEAGCAVLVSSHMLAEMDLLVDDAVIVEGGRTVLQAPLTELLPTDGVEAAADDLEALTDALDGVGLPHRRRDDRLVVAGVQPGQVADAASGAGVTLTALVAHRRTLEDVYVDATAGRGA